MADDPDSGQIRMRIARRIVVLSVGPDGVSRATLPDGTVTNPDAERVAAALGAEQSEWMPVCDMAEFALGRFPGTDPGPLVAALAVTPARRKELAAKAGRHGPDALRWALASDPERLTRTRLAYESADPDVAAWLAEDSESTVRASAAGNWRCPAETLAVLAADPDHVVRGRVASHWNTPETALRRLLADPVDDVRQAIAGRRHTRPAGLAAALAADPAWTVRATAAANPRTPPPELDRLAADPDPVVAHAAIGNPSLPPRVLDRLTDHSPVPGAQEAVAARLDLDRRARKPGLLDRDSRNSEASTRRGAAWFSADPDLLERLLADRDWEVRREAAANPALPADRLLGALDDRSLHVRSVAAGRLRDAGLLPD